MTHEDIQAIDSASFSAYIASAPCPVLIDFWAPWCAPCQTLAPLLQKVANRFEHELQVRKVNVDFAAELAARLNVRGIPTLILFKGGKLHSARVGLRTEAELVEWIESAL